MRAPRKKKYNAKGRHVEGIWCASEAEAVRCEQLLEMQKAGLISGFVPQPNYPLIVNGHKICTYRADFRYEWHGPEVRDEYGLSIIEEVKGLETPEWKLKAKLFAALHPELNLKVITLPRNKAVMAEQHGPQFVEAMVGKMSNFGEWIRLRYRGRVPE